MIEKLDQNVGKVMAKLKELDLLKNTMVVFYSDNGGLWGNPPLKGKKGTLYEGGIRVPMVVNYYGKIEPGSSCHVPVTSVDFFQRLLNWQGSQYQIILKWKVKVYFLCFIKRVIFPTGLFTGIFHTTVKKDFQWGQLFVRAIGN